MFEVIKSAFLFRHRLSQCESVPYRDTERLWVSLPYGATPHLDYDYFICRRRRRLCRILSILLPM